MNFTRDRLSRGLPPASLGRVRQTIEPFAMTPILDSRKLLAFTTLARVGSFTLAARELHLTQSAVSHAIKALEDELGLRLFDRMGRRVTLTAAGKQLLEHAHKILAEMKVARADMAALVK
jgi:DNA-binding transcriptional LysR family regulator